MKEGEASRTAMYMALFRALEQSCDPHVRLFVDPYAASFLPAGLRFVAELARVGAAGSLVRAFIDRRWPGARTSAVARTRFIDDTVESLLAAGGQQVVILGAGFDARAYRLAAMSNARVFEIDHPATSAVKRALVVKNLGALPAQVRYVPLDFESQTLASAMATTDYDPSLRTIFLWEGVTNYLNEEAVDSTLRWCAGAAARNFLIFTYVHRAVLENPDAFEGTRELFETLRASGERWTFGLDPAEVADFLGERGLVLDNDVGAADYREQYYGAAAAQMRGYEFYRIAVAHVIDVGEARSDRNRRSYDAIAAAWDETRATFHGRERELLDVFLDGIAPTSPILDLGCGTGRPFGEAILARGHALTGVDQASALLDLARARFPRGEWIESPIEGFHSHERFAAILCWDALFHIERTFHEELIARWATMLKPRGRLMLTVGGSDHPAFIDTMMGQTFFYDSHPPAVVEDVLRRRGFDIVLGEFLNVPTDGRDKGRYIIVAQAAAIKEP